MANNFSADSRFISYWNFDVSSFTNDALGSNHLTNSSITQSTSHTLIGSYSGYFYNAYGYRADVDLGDDFPYKNGTSNKKAFVSFGMSPYALNAKYYVISKYRAASNGRSYLIQCDSGYIKALIGYNSGDSVQTIQHETRIPDNGLLYHVRVWHDDIGGDDDQGRVKIQVYNVSSATYVGSATYVSSVQHIHVNSYEFCVGAQSQSHGDLYRGHIDALVIAKDWPTDEEAHQIMLDTFDPSSVSVVNTPFAYFAGSPTSGTAPLTVSFTDGSSNSPTAWAWSFGDASSSTAQNPSHDYTDPGSYTVGLTVSNSAGEHTSVRSSYIFVGSVFVSSVSLTSSFDSGNGVAEATFETSGSVLNIYTQRDSSGHSDWTDWFHFKLSGVMSRI
jgi:PKD repeat protein